MGRFSKLEIGKVKIPAKSSPVKEADNAEELSYDAAHYLDKAEEVFFLGDFKKALRLYSRALQIDNSLLEGHIGQIYSLIYQKQLKEADLWIGRSLQFFPDNPALISLQGVIYAYKGMMRRAIGSCDYAMSKGAHPLVWINRGEVLIMHENQNAFFCFEKAMAEVHATEWKIPARIGIVCFRQKQFTRAAEYLQKALQAKVNNYYLWYLLGESFAGLGWLEKAREAFKHSLEYKENYLPTHKALQRLSQKSMIGKFFSRIFGKFKK